MEDGKKEFEANVGTIKQQLGDRHRALRQTINSMVYWLPVIIMLGLGVSFSWKGMVYGEKTQGNILRAILYVVAFVGSLVYYIVKHKKDIEQFDAAQAANVEAKAEIERVIH